MKSQKTIRKVKIVIFAILGILFFPLGCFELGYLYAVKTMNKVNEVEIVNSPMDSDVDELSGEVVV